MTKTTESKMEKDIRRGDFVRIFSLLRGHYSARVVALPGERGPVEDGYAVRGALDGDLEWRGAEDLTVVSRPGEAL